MAGLLAVLFWSMSAAVVVMAPGVDPFLFIGLEHAIGFAVFLLRWLVLRRNPLPALRAMPPWYLGAGLMGISLHEVTWVVALRQAPPMEATLIIYLWPLLVVIFTAMALRQKLCWFHGIGSLCGLVGVTVLLGRGLDLGSLSLLPGHGIALISALSWSVFAAIAARQKEMSADALSLIFLVSSLLNLAYWFWGLDAPSAPERSLWIIAICSMPLMIAYPLWDYAMKHGDTRLVGIASFLIPVLAALSLVALGAAEPTPHLMIALALVMLGIGFAKYGRKLERIAGCP